MPCVIHSNFDVFPLGRWPEIVRDISDGMDDALDEALGQRSIYDLLEESETDLPGSE